MEQWHNHCHFTNSENHPRVQCLFDAIDTVASLQKDEKLLVHDNLPRKMKILYSWSSLFSSLFTDDEMCDTVHIIQCIEDACAEILEEFSNDEKCIHIYSCKIISVLPKLNVLCTTYPNDSVRKQFISMHGRLENMLVLLKWFEWSEKTCASFCSWVRLGNLESGRNLLSWIKEITDNIETLKNLPSSLGKSMSSEMRKCWMNKLNNLHISSTIISVALTRTSIKDVVCKPIVGIIADYLLDFTPFVWADDFVII